MVNSSNWRAVQVESCLRPEYLNLQDAWQDVLPPSMPQCIVCIARAVTDLSNAPDQVSGARLWPIIAKYTRRAMSGQSIDDFAQSWLSAKSQPPI